MEKEVLIKIRKKLKMKKYPLILNISGGNEIIDERTHFVMWDDTNAIIYVIESNRNLATQARWEANVKAVPYSEVLAVDVAMSIDDLKVLAESFVADGFTTQASIQKQIDIMSNLKDATMYIKAETNEDELNLYKGNYPFDRAKVSNKLPLPVKDESAESTSDDPTIIDGDSDVDDNI